MDLTAYHRRHWEKRWGARALDSWLGGRGIGPQNKLAAEIAVNKLGATRILDLGCGCWRLVNYCHELGASLLAGVDVPIGRGVAMAPSWALRQFTWDPSVLQWPDNFFDVVHQRNALACMRSTILPKVVSEIARMAPIFISSGSLRCRFWEGPRDWTMAQRIGWLKNEISRWFDLESTHKHGLSVWRRRAHVDV